MSCRLETDIQTLEQHLESMRAAYQLNQEKLDYNYRVLLERDAENQATITQQKRKISKQRDLLSTLMVSCNCHLQLCLFFPDFTPKVYMYSLLELLELLHSEAHPCLGVACRPSSFIGPSKHNTMPQVKHCQPLHIF